MKSRVLDKTAIALSGLCLVHCLALPLAITLLPFLNELGSGHLHAELLLVVVPLSVLAFVAGFGRHRSGYVLAAGALALAVLIAGGTLAHDRYGLAADRALTITGSLLLAVAHFYNSRLSRHRARH